nr:methyltransferase domain-containing protein [Bosea sp. ASV33]
MRDNTRHRRFVQRSEEIFGRKVKHLDIGCAGGGLVWDFTIAGNLSIGIEGSDYSRRNSRAEWGTIPDRLFTADVCYPFEVKQDGARVLFDVISAWELFEHIPTDRVDDVITHLLAHLSPEGVVVCSIATFNDIDPATGTNFHQTVKPKAWWEERFSAQGLKPVAGLFEAGDFVRGAGHSGDDWDARTSPHLGFHLVLRRQ